MPKFGIFQNFPDIGQIPTGDISRWLRPSPDPSKIEDYLGNKMLYPETVPIAKTELAIELAVFEEIKKRFQRSLNLA